MSEEAELDNFLLYPKNLFLTLKHASKYIWSFNVQMIDGKYNRC